MKFWLTIKMNKQTLEQLTIHGAKVKKVIETDKLYLLYSLVGREPGTEPWFSDKEVEGEWKDRLGYSKNIKYAQELGFNLTQEEIEILKKEGYTILGFAKP